MTELAELAALARMSPTPTEYDWTALAEALGTMPPPDYVELVNTYGGGTFDNDVIVFTPGSSFYSYDMLRGGLSRIEDVEEQWDDDPDLPRPAQLEGKRLINWGGTPDAEFLYWVAAPGAPSTSWTVAMEQGKDLRWEFFDMGTVDFLHGLLTGEVRSRFVPVLDRPHSYDRY
jgi:hypothetical protein